MRLQALGWNEFFEAQWNSEARSEETAARVIAQHREQWQVAGEFGECRAETSGTLRLAAEQGGDWPAVGDWVTLSGDTRQGATIRQVLSRRTQIVRKTAGRRVAAQLLAANVDTILVIMALDGDYNPRRLERYLAQGFDSGARVVVLLNKADLCEQAESRAEEMRRIALGTEVLCVSATTGHGMGSTDLFLRCGQTVVLLGSSGVGKSTLLNRFLQSERQRTKPVRSSDSRGRHTTTARQLFFLPSGAMVIDTPGLRELQLWDSETGLAQAFGDLETLAQQCRFRNCTHNGEPGCAIAAAVEEGNLDKGRLENHRKIQREQAFLQRKLDRDAQQKAKEHVKAIHRAARQLYRMRGSDGKP